MTAARDAGDIGKRVAKTHVVTTTARAAPGGREARRRNAEAARPQRTERRSYWLTAGAFATLLLTGSGLNAGQQGAPVVPKQPSGLKAAHGWVIDRVTQAAPDLFFSSNAHSLSRPEQRKLAHIAGELEGILHDSPDLVIVIEGHSDDRGLAQYNEQLGLERADAAKSGLLNRGFPEDHLRTVSFSHRAPVCLTPNDRCRQKNRRVHFRAAQPMSIDVAGGANR